MNEFKQFSVISCQLSVDEGTELESITLHDTVDGLRRKADCNNE